MSKIILKVSHDFPIVLKVSHGFPMKMALGGRFREITRHCLDSSAEPWINQAEQKRCTSRRGILVGRIPSESFNSNWLYGKQVVVSLINNSWQLQWGRTAPESGLTLKVRIIIEYSPTKARQSTWFFQTIECSSFDIDFWKQVLEKVDRTNSLISNHLGWLTDFH